MSRDYDRLGGCRWSPASRMWTVCRMWPPSSCFMLDIIVFPRLLNFQAHLCPGTYVALRRTRNASRRRQQVSAVRGQKDEQILCGRVPVSLKVVHLINNSCLYPFSQTHPITDKPEYGYGVERKLINYLFFFLFSAMSEQRESSSRVIQVNEVNGS